MHEIHRVLAPAPIAAEAVVANREAERIRENIATREPVRTADSSEALELARLRAQVAGLRAQVVISKQSVRVRSAPVSMPTSVLDASAEVTVLARHPSETWADAGYASPADALQTHWWAIRSGDIAKFKDSVLISDTLRATIDKSFPVELRFGRSIEEGLMMPAQAQDRDRGFAGYNIIDQQVVSDGEVDLDVETQFKSGESERQKWKFVKIDGQWRQWIDEEFVGVARP
jgi:hypothetical protein